MARSDLGVNLLGRPLLGRLSTVLECFPLANNRSHFRLQIVWKWPCNPFQTDGHNNCFSKVIAYVCSRIAVEQFNIRSHIDDWHIFYFIKAEACISVTLFCVFIMSNDLLVHFVNFPCLHLQEFFIIRHIKNAIINNLIPKYAAFWPHPFSVLHFLRSLPPIFNFATVNESKRA